MEQVTGTAWIQDLRKEELIAVCKENNLEIVSEKVDELRRLLREFVKNKLDKNTIATIKGLKKLRENQNLNKIKQSEDNNGSSVKVQANRMEITGNLDFDCKKDDWEQYVDRMEQFFMANDVTDNSKQRDPFK
jgi:hypothetical protein